MLPRRCKKCRCYVAPQLVKCPRCGVTAASVVSKPTKEDKRAARAALDAKVPVLSAAKIHWIPSEFSLRVHQAKLGELARLLDKADDAKGRNAIRSEIRITKAHLARKTVPPGKKGWTTENVPTKHSTIIVFVSPKGHRYVLAERDRPAHLLIEPAKKKHRRGTPVIRLERFEQSSHAKALKRAQKEETEHSKRKKVKKAHRAKKRLSKRVAE